MLGEAGRAGGPVRSWSQGVSHRSLCEPPFTALARWNLSCWSGQHLAGTGTIRGGHALDGQAASGSGVAGLTRRRGDSGLLFPTPFRRPENTYLINAALQARDLDRMPPWDEALVDYLQAKGVAMATEGGNR